MYIIHICPVRRRVNLFHTQFHYKLSFNHMKGSSSIGLRKIHSQKRQRLDSKTRVATLVDLDVLDCPICFEPLTIPTFQCDDGHLVCCYCLSKLDNKCPGPACDLPIGNKRCISIEKVLDTVFVTCRNAQFGCTDSFLYGQVSTHEKECTFSPFPCPKLGCIYTGSYKSIYDHFVSNHSIDSEVLSFLCGHSFDAEMNINDKILVLWEYNEKLLFGVQCFRERRGVYVTVRSIAQFAPELGKFSYRLSYFFNGHCLTYKAPEVKRILEVNNTQRPQESFVFVPCSLLQAGLLKMKLSIKKLKQK